MENTGTNWNWYHARTLTGLEGSLEAELRALGAVDVQTEGRVVRFRADRALLYRANLWCRTAIRILRPLGEYPAGNEDQLYAAARNIDWGSWMKATGTLAVDAAVHSSFTTHSLYVAQRVKDAVADQFRERTGKRPSVDLRNPDLRVVAALFQDRVQLFVDSSGESLHRRGYRTATGEAPMSEVLAAGILSLSEWDGSKPVVDPMCGSGTLLIEAAMKARRMAPGLMRRDFGFQRWPDYDRGLFERLREEARAALLPKARVPFVGVEKDPKVAEIARRNAERAGLAGDIRIEAGDFFEFESLPSDPGLVVMNPPYDERLKVDQVGEFYEHIGHRLKRRYGGWTANVLSGNAEAGKRFGLRASKKVALRNGPLECRLFRFEITAPKSDTKGPAWKAPTAVPVLETANLPDPADARSSAQFEAFRNRLKKDAKHYGKWAKRLGVTCYRVYDRDIPEIPLILDLYGDRLHVSELDRNHDRAPEVHAAWIRRLLREASEILGVPEDRIYSKRRKPQKGTSQYTVQAETGEFIEVGEGGHRFWVNLADYLDTGLFLDHRFTRGLVEKEAKGKDVLNLFGYTGSFSVYAAAGGARSTTTVDTSQTYLRWAEQNLALNGFKPPKHQCVRSDVMEFLERLPVRGEAPFDLAVVDPPTFSNSKTTMRVFDVQKDHPRLLELVYRQLRPGGTIFFSTNFQKFKFEAADLLPGASIEEITRKTVPLDFERRKSHRAWKIDKPR